MKEEKRMAGKKTTQKVVKKPVVKPKEKAQRAKPIAQAKARPRAPSKGKR